MLTVLKIIGALFALMWSWALTPDDSPTDPPSDDPPADETPTEPFKAFASKKEHDDYLETKLKERLERKDRKLAEEKAEAERQAREKALKDNEDWKKLAGEHAETISQKNARIEELQGAETERDTLKERVEALEERLKGVMKPRLEAVPELFRPFVEGMTVEEQAKWLEDNEEKLEVVGSGEANGQRPRGSRATGRPAKLRQQSGDDERAKQAREAQRQRTHSAI